MTKFARLLETPVVPAEPRAQLWLNLGLPQDIALDVIQPRRNYNPVAAAQNKKLEELLALGSTLEPGESVEVTLTVTIRRTNI